MQTNGTLSIQLFCSGFILYSSLDVMFSAPLLPTVSPPQRNGRTRGI